MAHIAASATTDRHVSLNETFGILFASFILAMTLYGATLYQTYVYFSRFPNDNRWTKGVMALVWMVDTCTTALVSRTQYHYLVTNFIYPFERLGVPLTFAVEKGLSALGILAVHLFYAGRIWTFSSKNVYIAGGIVIPAFGSYALSIVAAAQLYGQDHFANLITHNLKIVLGMKDGLAVLSDLIIVLANIYFLRPSMQPKMRTPANWFGQILLFGISRGTCFTILQIALFITFLASPHTQFWILLNVVSYKVYINSLCTMLNSRKASRGCGINEEDNIVSFKTAVKENHITAGHEGAFAVNPLQQGQVATIELERVGTRSGFEQLSPKRSMESSLRPRDSKILMSASGDFLIQSNQH